MKQCESALESSFSLFSPSTTYLNCPVYCSTQNLLFSTLLHVRGSFFLLDPLSQRVPSFSSSSPSSLQSLSVDTHPVVSFWHLYSLLFLLLLATVVVVVAVVVVVVVPASKSLFTSHWTLRVKGKTGSHNLTRARASATALCVLAYHMAGFTGQMIRFPPRRTLSK